MSDKKSHQRPWRTLVTTMAAAGVLGLAGCTDEDSSYTPDYQSLNALDEFTKNTPADIAQESDPVYSNNVNGLITGSTLEGWIDDWQANRPDGIDGDLVILSVSVEEDDNGNRTYIEPADGVRSYAIDTNRLIQTRSNGVIYTRSMVPDGEEVDAFLEDYDIDPTSDMIVWAMGEGGYGQAMRQGRGWYMLRYWGTEKEHLALLNGGADHGDVLDQSYTGSSVSCDETLDASCLPGGGEVGVRALPEENTALQATLQDVMSVVRGDTSAFIWDARSDNQYQPSSMDDFQNDGAKQGHPVGAVQLNFVNILRSDGSFRYRPYGELEDFMAGNAVDGAEFQKNDGGSLVPLGTSITDHPYPDQYEDGQTVITYCETTFRAMITGFASAAILGNPTRFYDGAMVEWNSMAHVQDKNGQFLLPYDSPWRTDKDGESTDSGLSYYMYSTADIGSRNFDDVYADDTRAIIRADKAYKEGAGDEGDDSSSDDGGGAPVANPCGG